MSALSDLEKHVALSTSVEHSALELIQGLAAKLAEAGTDPEKLAELQATLRTSADALAAAVAANTKLPIVPV